MDVAAIGLPVFGSSRCPSSRTVNSGDRSLLLVAGWNEVAAATKASTDSNALDRAKSAASTCGIDAPTARAKNAILTRRSERGPKETQDQRPRPTTCVAANWTN